MIQRSLSICREQHTLSCIASDQGGGCLLLCLLPVFLPVTYGNSVPAYEAWHSLASVENKLLSDTLLPRELECEVMGACAQTAAASSMIIITSLMWIMPLFP